LRFPNVVFFAASPSSFNSIGTSFSLASSPGMVDDYLVTCAFLNMTSCCSKLVGGPFLNFTCSGWYCKKDIVDKLDHIIIIIIIDKKYKVSDKHILTGR
jgi:hypothetical protein